MAEDAGRIWAEATAHRDHRGVSPSDIETGRSLIRDVMQASSRSRLLMAFSGAEAVGFAAAEEAPHEAGCALLHYFAVRPSVWGRGVATELLRTLAATLARDGFSRSILWVYTTNTRATRLYERVGWRREGQPFRHERTGRPMWQYGLDLTGEARE